MVGYLVINHDKLERFPPFQGGRGGFDIYLVALMRLLEHDLFPAKDQVCECF
jgi:hypothetical protein